MGQSQIDMATHLFEVIMVRLSQLQLSFFPGVYVDYFMHVGSASSTQSSISVF
jgi:hypothetical protein